MNKEKYPALSLISALYKIFGWIALLVGVACIAWAVFGSSMYALILALSAFFAALLSFAFAEAIIVLVDIEFNTRTSNKIEQQTDHGNKIEEKFLDTPKSERPKWLPNCPRCGGNLKEGATGCASCGFLFSEWQ
jgi:hypothetical protein